MQRHHVQYEPTPLAPRGLRGGPTRLAWRIALVVAFTLAGFARAEASPQDGPSGTAVSVIPAAAAAGSSGRRVLKVDGDIFMGDRVQTGPGGQAQIEFKDQTKLVVGPNSSMTIDAFVFDSQNTARKISMNAAKGAFRFITGHSQKQAYSIKTPTATIGVRGTRFDFTIAGSGEMTFALFDGQARICDDGGYCRDVRGNCEVVVAPAGGGVDSAVWSVPIAARFPYIASQASLLPRFRVNVSGCSGREGRQAAVSGNTERAPRAPVERVARQRETAPPSEPPSCGEGGYGRKHGKDGPVSESTEGRRGFAAAKDGPEGRGQKSGRRGQKGDRDGHSKADRGSRSRGRDG